MIDPGPRRTHWGALAFTLVAGLVMVIVVAPWLTSVAPANGGDAGGGVGATPTPTPDPVTEVATPAPEELDSEFMWQTLPAEIVRGDTTQVSLMFRNTGTVAWIRGTAAEIRLGIVGDDPSYHELGLGPEWPSATRVAVQAEEVVRPGQLATFIFDFVGAEAGEYRIPLMPVVDGVAWLGDDDVVAEITVREG